MAFLGGCSGNEQEAAVTVAMAEQNGSTQSGNAVLTAVGDDTTRVELSIGSGGDAGQPVRIYRGSCERFDTGAAYVLEDVVGGESITVLDVSLDELQDGDFVISVHDSGARRVREDRGVSRPLALLIIALTVAGCSLGDDEPKSAVAASQFVTELIRLGSGEEQGRVGLSAVGDKTRVVVELSEPPKDPREVEIHSGNCDVLGTAVYGLQPLEDGVSTTVVDIGLEPLRRMGYTVMVSDPSGTPGGLCGDLAQAQPPSAAPTFD